MLGRKGARDARASAACFFTRSCRLCFELIADGDQLVHLGDDAFCSARGGSPKRKERTRAVLRLS